MERWERLRNGAAPTFLRQGRRACRITKTRPAGCSLARCLSPAGAAVQRIDHLYDAGIAAGSDHAVVVADLAIALESDSK
jgi:hypothetical protein